MKGGNIMINAKTAKSLADDYCDKSITAGDKVPACVYRLILDAAKSGEYSVQVGSLTVYQIERLHAQGFYVTRPYSKIFDGCTIRWGGEE
jgi:hypothetical protein